MRYECKYCGKNFTPMILAQLEGKLTKAEVERMCDCRKKEMDVSKLRYNGEK